MLRLALRSSDRSKALFTPPVRDEHAEAAAARRRELGKLVASSEPTRQLKWTSAPRGQHTPLFLEYSAKPVRSVAPKTAPCQVRPPETSRRAAHAALCRWYKSGAGTAVGSPERRLAKAAPSLEAVRYWRRGESRVGTLAGPHTRRDDASARAACRRSTGHAMLLASRRSGCRGRVGFDAPPQRCEGVACPHAGLVFFRSEPALVSCCSPVCVGENAPLSKTSRARGKPLTHHPQSHRQTVIDQSVRAAPRPIDPRSVAQVDKHLSAVLGASNPSSISTVQYYCIGSLVYADVRCLQDPRSTYSKGGVCPKLRSLGPRSHLLRSATHGAHAGEQKRQLRA